MADSFDRVLPAVEKTIEILEKAKFRLDPIAGEEYSRSTSIISSAYKRHGKIIEAALRERLKDNDQFVVWDEPLFKVSQPVQRQLRFPVGVNWDGRLKWRFFRLRFVVDNSPC